ETTPEPEPLPTVPDEYASAAFDAWVTGDDAVLERMLAPEALEDLRQVNADPSADWEFSRCEGAACSSYCEWIGPDGALTFRVANEAASNGEDHAIAEVITTGGCFGAGLSSPPDGRWTGAGHRKGSPRRMAWGWWVVRAGVAPATSGFSARRSTN